MLLLVLDPRIMYLGLETDAADDATLLADLERSKTQLQCYFQREYAPSQFEPATVSSDVPSSTPSSANSSQRMDFTSRYQRKHRVAVNELEEFLKLEPEDFTLCEPLVWWRGRRAQFPNLYLLACDILAIPGLLAPSCLIFQCSPLHIFRICSCSGKNLLGRP